MLQHAREIAPSVSWEILLLIKRSGGMCVNELSAALKMSYMGVKQHCDDLKRRGYVDTWRRPKQTGRPEKIYRPAEKLDVVLPNWGSELCLGLLSLLAQAYGDTVPERMLYSFLQQKVERWNSRLKGKTPHERAVELAKLRNADGWICDAVHDERGLRLVDHHSPLHEVARHYPAVCDLEVRVLSRIFGHTLQRRLNGLHTEWIISESEPAPPPVVVQPPKPGPAKERKAARLPKSPEAISPAKTKLQELELTPTASPSPAKRIREDLFD